MEGLRGQTVNRQQEGHKSVTALTRKISTSQKHKNREKLTKCYFVDIQITDRQIVAAQSSDLIPN
jgi:hypothetical protein